MQSTFDQAHLTRLGFAGWLPLQTLSAPSASVPRRSGIYVVTHAAAVPQFLGRSVGGRFKGKDPTVSEESLTARWLDGAATLYIGRASNLRSRITLLARYGQGEPVAHQGGRYLWQLAAHDQLQVAWRLEDNPVLAETMLLEDFESAFGQLPFANLVRGARPLTTV